MIIITIIMQLHNAQLPSNTGSVILYANYIHFHRISTSEKVHGVYYEVKTF